MAFAASIFRYRKRDLSDATDWEALSCYASAQHFDSLPLIESCFFRSEMNEEVCDWWFNVAIPKLCPPEIYKQFTFITEENPWHEIYKDGKYYITVQVDTEEIMWQDANIMFMLCRYIQEQPYVVQKAFDLCHTFSKAPFDSLIYYAMTHNPGRSQNCNHMLVGRNLHIGEWIRPEVQNYSFQHRWKGYTNKQLLQQFKGNSINTQFLIERGKYWEDSSVELGQKFEEYLIEGNK